MSEDDLAALRQHERAATARVHDSLPPVERSREFSTHEWRQNADLDAVMDVCIAHAHRKCAEVWPGGTVDPSEIEWSWSNYLRTSAGYCYGEYTHMPNYSRCNRDGCDGHHPVQIKLAPGYYYSNGLDTLLSIVRHELIHAWQSMHPDGGRISHGPKFRQWVDDMDTHRYCKMWSK